MAYIYLEPGHLPAPDQNEPADVAAIEQRAQQRASDLLVGRTTAQRNALAGTDLWAGRTIYNTTSQRTEEYTGTGWRPVGSIDLAAHEADLASHSGYILKATGAAKGDLLVATAAGVIVRKPAGPNGTVIVADSTKADGLDYIPHRHARIITKETSEALSNTTVFQNDDDLFFTVEANKAYRIALDLGYMAGVTGRLRLTWASSTAQVPGGRWGGVGDVGSTLTNRQFNEALTLNGAGPQTQKHAVITGLFRVTVAGTIRLQWAQLVADAEATTVLQHSCLTVWEK